MKNIYKELFDNIKLDWKDFFSAQFKKPYFLNLIKKLVYEFNNYECYPKTENIFKIFKILSCSEIKVVIFGQDPYHNKGQADGLAFSCNLNPLPPSLKNILKELKNDLNIDRKNGSLFSWVSQGVFLYNSFLTVRRNNPNSHENLGWQQFTIALIKYLNSKNKNLIYVLWGNKAKNYLKFIESKNIITSSHPSPFSYANGFENSKPFSKINKILENNNYKKIFW